MSRSLSRIRNLISEIEEIQRQGQQGAKPVNLRAAVLPAEPVAAAMIASTPAPQAKNSVEADPFDAIEDLVHLDTKRTAPAGAQSGGRVFVQLSGQVALSLQIEDSDETVELKQVGDMIEIRFADGKAFHIPFKAVA